MRKKAKTQTNRAKKVWHMKNWQAVQNISNHNALTVRRKRKEIQRKQQSYSTDVWNLVKSQEWTKQRGYKKERSDEEKQLQSHGRQGHRRKERVLMWLMKTGKNKKDIADNIIERPAWKWPQHNSRVQRKRKKWKMMTMKMRNLNLQCIQVLFEDH